MIIEISDKLMSRAKLSQGDILLQVAIALFKEEKVTLAQASEIAELHQIQFQQELAKRKIPIHYGEEELKNDLETIKKIKIK
ncbi:MAG: UPF0175 family protein [Saprospiraceae bacterium]